MQAARSRPLSQTAHCTPRGWRREREDQPASKAAAAAAAAGQGGGALSHVHSSHDQGERPPRPDLPGATERTEASNRGAPRCLQRRPRPPPAGVTGAPTAAVCWPPAPQEPSDASLTLLPRLTTPCCFGWGTRRPGRPESLPIHGCGPQGSACGTAGGDRASPGAGGAEGLQRSFCANNPPVCPDFTGVYMYSDPVTTAVTATGTTRSGNERGGPWAARLSGGGGAGHPERTAAAGVRTAFLGSIQLFLNVSKSTFLFI